MSLDDDFRKAAERVQQLKTRPSNDELLELYALYKQGSVGDATGERPGLFDLKGRKKFDAWASKKGTAKTAAQQGYVDYVTKLVSKSG